MTGLEGDTTSTVVDKTTESWLRNSWKRASPVMYLQEEQHATALAVCLGGKKTAQCNMGYK